MMKLSFAGLRVMRHSLLITTPAPSSLSLLHRRQQSSEGGEKVKVYVDGSCLSNGKKNPVGGYGVWFGNNDPRNESEPLLGEKQTNNVAELMAAKRSVEILLGGAKEGKVKEKEWVINTDSDYTLQSLKSWIYKWKKNGWKTASGAPVKNEELIRGLDKVIMEAKELGVKVKWEKAKGHSGEEGNEAAHLLAYEAAQRAKEISLNEKKG